MGLFFGLFLCSLLFPLCFREVDVYSYPGIFFPFFSTHGIFHMFCSFDLEFGGFFSASDRVPVPYRDCFFQGLRIVPRSFPAFRLHVV